MSVRERLVDLVERSGKSQSEIARRVGKERSWLNRRLKGRTEIAAEDVPILAEALGVPIEEFFTEEHSMNEPEGAGLKVTRGESGLDPLEQALLNFVTALLELLHASKAQQRGQSQGSPRYERVDSEE